MPEIPLDSFHSISPPSLTLPHLLGFDLQDLNNHKQKKPKKVKGISPAKVMPIACSLIPAKGMLPVGRRDKGEQEAVTHQFVTSSLI